MNNSFSCFESAQSDELTAACDLYEAMLEFYHS